MHALLEGDLRAFSYIDEDNKFLMRTIGVGAWFGEVSLFDGKERSHEVKAVNDAALLFLPLAGFNRIVEQEPRYYRNFALLLSSYVRMAARSMRNDRLDARQRTARAFLRLASAHGRADGNSIVVDINISQSEIASLVGVSRPYMNELLAEWQKDGILCLTGGLIRIPALERLKAMTLPAETKHRRLS